MVVYRKLRVDEAQDFWNLMNQLDNETKYMLYEPEERKEKASDISRIENLITESLQGDNLLLVSEVEKQLVGYIAAQKGSLNRISHTAYIVVGILKDYTNKGIGTEFFKQLDLWAIDKKVSRLELTVVCENEIAKHLYEKSGFVIEGIKRKSVMVEGRFLDEFYMAKIIE